MPGRVFFRNRQWPVGYEFPACVECNRATRCEEQAVAMLSRIYPDAETTDEQAALEKLMGEVHHNHPNLFSELQPSLRQLRDARTKYGLGAPTGGPLTSLPVLSVAGPIVNDAIEQFSRKLFCALFYKHAEQILGHVGGIAFRWYSNLQVNAGEIPRTIASVVPSLPLLERNSLNLDDQFFYRWGVTDTKRMAAFLAFFRESFAVLGVVHQDASELNELKDARILRPYTRSTPQIRP